MFGVGLLPTRNLVICLLVALLGLQAFCALHKTLAIEHGIDIRLGTTCTSHSIVDDCSFSHNGFCLKRKINLLCYPGFTLLLCSAFPGI